jgi:hypothetical protein
MTSNNTEPAFPGLIVTLNECREFFDYLITTDTTSTSDLDARDKIRAKDLRNKAKEAVLEWSKYITEGHALNDEEKAERHKQLESDGVQEASKDGTNSTDSDT